MVDVIEHGVFMSCFYFGKSAFEISADSLQQLGTCLELRVNEDLTRRAGNQFRDKNIPCSDRKSSSSV